MKSRWSYEAKTQSIVCLTDGSNNAHKAFEVAKALRKDDDVLSVVHIKSDKDYHDATTNFKSDQIQLRYETELTPLLPSSKWRYDMVTKKDNVSTKRAVGMWVSGLQGRAHRRSQAFADAELPLYWLLW